MILTKLFHVGAVRDLGKYRLAPRYDQFQVDPVKWWGPERHAQHLSALRNFTQKLYDMYKKPRAAGPKSSSQSKNKESPLARTRNGANCKTNIKLGGGHGVTQVNNHSPGIYYPKNKHCY